MSAWAGRAARSAFLGVGVASLLGAAPVPALEVPAVFESFGETEGLPIRRIEIVPRDLYEPLPPGGLRPLYSLANRLHIRTREKTVRDLLLIAPGQPWSETRGRETARALRALRILEPTHLVARRVRDSVDVRVETRDAWTTAPEFAIESGAGQNFMTVSLVERNLLGLGKSVSLVYRETPEAVTRSASWHDPGVFGSRLRLGVTGGTGSEGASQSLDIRVPFYAEDTPFSYGVQWNLVTSVARLFQEGAEAADFDRRIEETEVWWGRGGRQGHDVRRLIYVFHVHDRRFGPSRLQLGAPIEFDGPEENLHTRRLSAEFHWWRPRFSEWRHVERLGGIEDVDLGTSIRVTGGFSPEALGATADEGYGAARLDQGIAAGRRGFGEASLNVSSWLRREPRDLAAQARGRWVTQFEPHRTLVLSAHAATGYRVARDRQEIVGGLNGLRAFGVRELAGQRLWRFNAEHRWLVAHDAFDLVSFGAVAFYDAARAWGPGTAGVGWHHGAGVGLRISLPRSGQDRVARFDIAWPLEPAPDGRREPVFSFGSGQAF